MVFRRFCYLKPPFIGFFGRKTFEKPSKNPPGTVFEGFPTFSGSAGGFFEGFPHFRGAPEGFSKVFRRFFEGFLAALENESKHCFPRVLPEILTSQSLAG